MKLLCYDFETTGLPNWKEPSEDPKQPHIVECGAVLVDSETREILESLDVLVRPDGWVIPQECIDLNGITNEFATEHGIPEKEAIERFIDMHSRADQRIGFNEMFDARIARIACKRFLTEEIAEAFKAAPKLCTMWESKPICRIPHPTKKGDKLPKLSEAYTFFTGEVYEDAHRAMPDALATLSVYWGIKDGATPRAAAESAVEAAADSSAAIPLGL